MAGNREIEVRFLEIDKPALAGKRDRHEHLGKGKIGLAGFKALVKDKQLKSVNFILETPKDTSQDDPRNLGILRRFRAT